MHLLEASLDPPDGISRFLDELGDGENGFMGADLGLGKTTLDEYLRRQVDMARGVDLQPGWVPMTTYWLLDDAGKLVGMSRLRHSLTPSLRQHGGHVGYYVRPSQRRKGYGTAILKLTLEAARALGIARCLLTVDSANLASIRVIEANSGVLEDERRDETTGRPYRRYWIG